MKRGVCCYMVHRMKPIYASVVCGYSFNCELLPLTGLYSVNLASQWSVIPIVLISTHPPTMVSVASVMFRMWIQINPRASCSAPTTQATILLVLVTAGVMTRKGLAVFCRKHAQEDALSLGFDDMLYVKSCENESCSGRTPFISFRPPFRFFPSSLQSRHSIWPWDHVPSP